MYLYVVIWKNIFLNFLIWKFLVYEINLTQILNIH